MPAFARDHIKSALKKRVDALSRGYRQNVGMTGPLGTGKTHILQQAFKEFSRLPGILCVYVEADAIDYEQLASRWIGALLTGYMSSTGRGSGACELTGLLSACEPFIPQTVQAIHKFMKSRRRDKNHAYAEELFSLSRTLSEETGHKIVLIIDEFQELEKIPVPDPFALLGKEIMIEKDTLYLVSSSKPERARVIFRDKLSLLFGNFEVLQLKPFDFQETVDFLSQRLPRVQLTFRQKKLFFTLTHGEPLYLDLLVDRLKLYLPPQAEQFVSDPMLFLTFQEELYDRRGRIALLFEKLLQPVLRMSKENTPYIRTLLAISEGHHKLSNIASYIERSQADTKKILHKLLQEDRIHKCGSFYTMPDTLFRFWLREVFKRRNFLYYFDKKKVAEDLYTTLRETFERITHEEKRDYPAQVERLFKEFRNDVVEVEGKRWRCPHFTEIIRRPPQGRFTSLSAKNAKSRWFCCIIDECVREEDVLSFLEEIKGCAKKVHQKILITLGGIEQNAKLLAQNAKIQIWNSETLNLLLDLYDLPKIIRFDEGSQYGKAVGPMAEGLHTG